MSGCWCGTLVHCDGFYFVLVVKTAQRSRASELEQLRVKTHDYVWINAFTALALDLGRRVVERVEVINEDV